MIIYDYNKLAMKVEGMRINEEVDVKYVLYKQELEEALKAKGKKQKGRPTETEAHT